MDAKQLHDLGQQLRVDAVRAAAAAGSGHPTSSMSAADLMAVLLGRHLRYDFADPRAPRQRPADLLQGPRVAAAVRDVPGGGRDRRRRTAQLPDPGQPAGRASHPPAALGGRGHRLARPGPARRRRASRWPASPLDHSPYRVWVLCGDSELAEGSVWEAFEHAGYERLDNLTADRRREPARPARPDPARLGHRRLRPADRRVRLAHHRDRRARHRGHRRARTPRPLDDPGRAHRDHRPDQEGPRSGRGAGRRGSARQAAARPRRGHRRARRDPRPPGARAAARARPPGSTRPPPGDRQPRLLRLRMWRTRSPPGPRSARRWPRSACARADVVVLDGEVSDSTRTEDFAKAAPRPVLRVSTSPSSR